jgi:hypothetical protein
MTERHGSIGDIKTGSEQILEAMTDLEERSLKIDSGR